MTSTQRHAVRVLLVLLCLWFGAVEAPCAEPDQQDEETPAAEAREPSAEGAQEEAGEEQAEEPDPCAPAVDLGDAWVDALNRRVYRTVCGSARWFDSFFGNQRSFDEADRTYGWLSTQVLWSEYDEFEGRFRFQAKLDLPNLDRRFKLIVGRMSEREQVESPVDPGRQLPSSFRDTGDEEWLVGLGYDPLSTSRSRMSYSVGVKARMPPDPYGKARYRYNVFLSDNRLLRFREILFWRYEEGFGVTSAVDYDWRLRPELMVRWANAATFSESTLGADLWSSLTLYQGLRGGRGLAYRLWVEGETDAEVPLDRYGLRVTYRQSVFRDWLFGEIVTGVSWPREHLDETREASWGVGVGVEMQFGTRP